VEPGELEALSTEYGVTNSSPKDSSRSQTHAANRAGEQPFTRGRLLVLPNGESGRVSPHYLNEISCASGTFMGTQKLIPGPASPTGFWR